MMTSDVWFNVYNIFVPWFFMYFGGVDVSVRNNWVNHSVCQDSWQQGSDLCWCLDNSVRIWWQWSWCYGLGVKKGKLGESRISVPPGSASHYCVHRWTRDVSEAVTAPLLLDIDMSGSDLHWAGAEQSVLMGTWVRCRSAKQQEMF